MRRISLLLLICVMLVGLLPAVVFAQTEETILTEEKQVAEASAMDEAAEATVSEEELATWNSLKESFSSSPSVLAEENEAESFIESILEETKDIFEQYLQKLLNLFA